MSHTDDGSLLTASLAWEDGHFDRSGLGSFLCQPRECFMLVLTRKYQEKIRIGENITITVLRMKGKAVRLGIEAPADVPVIRGELTFEVEAASDGSPNIETETDENGSHRDGRAIAGAGGMAMKWTTESHPAAATRNDRPSGASVQFGRVPRDKVAEIMPKLVSGTAPLRAMMGQRS
jgi:carbon storage regulator